MSDETQAIAEGLRLLEQSGCAKRQAIECARARAETIIDLDLALALMGELEPRRAGALEQ